jgi:MFS family permease
MNSRIRWTPIALLETTNLLSGLSNGIVTIAIPWLVLERTGSVTSAGLVAALSALPGIIVSPLAGWAVDHFGRRIVSVLSDILSAVSVALIPLVAVFTDLSLAIILALATLGATFDPAGYTARRALIPDVATASGIEVTRLNGLHEGVFGIGWIIGPLAGSLLIAAFGETKAFWAPFAAFAISAILIAALRVTDAGQIAKAEMSVARIEPLSAWQNSVLGAKLIWRDHTLRALTIAVTVLGAIYLPTETVLLPAHYNGLGAPESLGFILAALAAGSVIGSFSYGWLNQHLTRRTIVYGALIGTSMTFIPMAFLPPIGIFMTFAFVFGLAWGPMQPLLTTIVQLRIEPDAQGRAFGIQTAAFYVAPPVAMFLAGVLAESFGVKSVMLGIAGLLTLTAFGVMRVKSLRDVDADRAS